MYCPLAPTIMKMSSVHLIRPMMHIALCTSHYEHFLRPFNKIDDVYCSLHQPLWKYPLMYCPLTPTIMKMSSVHLIRPMMHIALCTSHYEHFLHCATGYTTHTYVTGECIAKLFVSINPSLSSLLAFDLWSVEVHWLALDVTHPQFRSTQHWKPQAALENIIPAILPF